jgi:hypothetical protein
VRLRRRPIEKRDELIRPEHVCRPPKSRLWGSGPEYTPKDHEDVPAGTQWICECGRGWIVALDLPLWERCPSLDVKELLA